MANATLCVFVCVGGWAGGGRGMGKRNKNNISNCRQLKIYPSMQSVKGFLRPLDAIKKKKKLIPYD